jgi:pentatricopeptide repeat protein
VRQIFYGIPKQYVISWTTIIGGCIDNGKSKEALKLFYQMQESVGKMDHFTLTKILSTCSYRTTLDYVKQIHTHIFKIRFDMSPFLRSSLLEMYVKCSGIQDAHQLLNKMTRPNGVLRMQ